MACGHEYYPPQSHQSAGAVFDILPTQTSIRPWHLEMGNIPGANLFSLVTGIFCFIVVRNLAQGCEFLGTLAEGHHSRNLSIQSGLSTPARTPDLAWTPPSSLTPHPGWSLTWIDHPPPVLTPQPVWSSTWHHPHLEEVVKSSQLLRRKWLFFLF